MRGGMRASPMWSWPLTLVLVSAMLLLPLPVIGADATDEVVVRCLYHVGEFGTEMFRICVDQDLAAAKALSQYSADSREIVARCTKRMQHKGWATVKLCVDREIGTEGASKKD